jgi:hypothetical protein
MKRLLPLIFPAILILAGCQTARPLYYWGNYDASVYESYAKPGKTAPAEQAAKLEEDLAKAAARDLQPNPGLHAQLGYAYFQMGRIDAARKEFEAEKALFPESAAFIDRMLSRLKGNQAQ